jgi:hypothetical protein
MCTTQDHTEAVKFGKGKDKTGQDGGMNNFMCE